MDENQLLKIAAFLILTIVMTAYIGYLILGITGLCIGSFIGYYVGKYFIQDSF